MIKEAYINGVSTRKIERLAKELGIENISASQVSQINKGLDEQIREFREHPLLCMKKLETVMEELFPQQ